MMIDHGIANAITKSHAGLHELCTLANSVKSFLGPNKAYKFIFDQSSNECTLTCSAHRLLEGLDLSSAVGQLLNETVQVHHKTYKTGTTTLFFLVGAWSTSILECLRQGVPIPLIVSVMLEGLGSCIEEVHCFQEVVSNVLTAKDFEKKMTEDMIKSHSDPKSSNSMADLAYCSQSYLKYNKHTSVNQMNRVHSNRQACRSNKLSHSRYFLGAQKGIQNQTCEIPCYSHTLGILTKALSHGNQEVMNQVEKAIDHLCKETQKMHIERKTFHASQFHVCCLPGLSEVHLKASSGYITLVPLECAAIIKVLDGKSLRVLLLDGDLTEQYRHLGFNRATNVKVTSDIVNVDETMSREFWAQSACRNIMEANVDLVLVRGDVCPALSTLCIHKKILVVTHVKQNVLQAFSEATGAEPIAYLSQINQCCVGGGALVSMCTNGNSVVETRQKIAVTINANRVNLVTFILSNRLVSMLQIIEDQFWTCLYRIHNALQDQKVFYGGGAVELLCLSHLQRLQVSGGGSFQSTRLWTSTTTCYKASIYKCLAKGWNKYLSALLCNTGNYLSELDAMTFIQNEIQTLSCCDSPLEYLRNEYSKKVLMIDCVDPSESHQSIPVYDNVIPKLEAWRSALHLVLLVLQTDAEIITGSAAQSQILKAGILKDEWLFL
ncbi:Bardet-Biedl syndrome 12 [Pelobates cultripes]|uniref:Bardet-Biedl syndrome 12 n=1 Tax=Pelobates cultripes TaxID=61616 RepID=A0AAD1SG23_PELCU|nr:Bardet-Biedl syndrome 12 [Pelobates cultripes]